MMFALVIRSVVFMGFWFSFPNASFHFPSENDSTHLRPIEEIVKDVDGNIYPIVKIGDQIWMAEDLRATTYADGRKLSTAKTNHEWVEKNRRKGDRMCCFYNNDASGEYGALYNWLAATDGLAADSLHPRIQGICPDGWHLPADKEWEVLINYLGGEDSAAMQLKEKGSRHWNQPNTVAKDGCFFCALPGGERYSSDGSFHYQGCLGNWWTATQSDAHHAYFRFMDFNSKKVYHSANLKTRAFSVRCLKNIGD